MTEIIRRATVEDIVAHRNKALALYSIAYERIADAAEAIKQAAAAGQQASPGITSYNWNSDTARRCFLGGIEVPDRDSYTKEARKLTDIDVWSHIIKMTDLERLMDKAAKDQLRRDLMDEPPEVTIENIFATLDRFSGEAGMIFRRGIANVFSGLDRRFRSHDGWKIGSRVILTRAFDERGWWNHYRNERDAIQDIERTFFVLDGQKPPPNYAGLIGAIETARAGRHGARQSEAESDFFKIRIFMNGNAHVWFKRDDLVARVNQLLGEYYGASIPEEREPDADTGLHDAKTTPAKRYGFFPTPTAAADEVFRDVSMMRAKDKPPLRVLEPSAGTGNLARRCIIRLADFDAWGRERYGSEYRFDNEIDCIEIQPHLAEALRAEGIFRRVVCADFLGIKPDPDRLYDRIIMNPPFDRERDIDHVMHALSFLAPDGLLVAIMSAGTEFRETRKSIAFRALMESMGARWRDLPPGSFAEVGTYANTIIVKVWKDGRKAW
ncbi:MAG: hypothetical protein DI527_00535 [Chelatococcus sp.]|nr:MAG: hypothetical protein DI527_00535 [Chelatococcus sp.]